MSTMSAIDAEYKARWWELGEQVGHQLTTKDAEWWELSAWYQQRVGEVIKARDHQLAMVQVAKVREARRFDKGQGGDDEPSEPVVPVVKVGSGDRACRVCGGVIEATGKRGRPRETCLECVEEMKRIKEEA